MLDRLKRVLVESYIGAIALGYVLAQDIMHFANIFASPLATWIARDEYRRLIPQGLQQQNSAPTGFPYGAAYPELIRFLVILLIWFVLLRWLYWNSDERGGHQNVVRAQSSPD